MSLDLQKSRRTGRLAAGWAIIGGAIALCGGCLSTPSQPVTARISSAPGTNTSQQAGNVPRPLPQDVSTQLIDLQQRLDELSQLLATISPRGDGLRPADQERLQALEKKAQWSDALAMELHNANSKTESLYTELATSTKRIAELRIVLTHLQGRTNDLEQKVADLSNKVEPIQDTLRILRSGNYEYYTVRRGDTCKSIAAQPSIYGDESKHLLIRQANRGQVADLDHLVPEELLIIPRPKGDASHEP
jgi:nucleoid-associated protein YgaU